MCNGAFLKTGSSVDDMVATIEEVLPFQQSSHIAERRFLIHVTKAWDWSKATNYRRHWSSSANQIHYSEFGISQLPIQCPFKKPLYSRHVIVWYVDRRGDSLRHLNFTYGDDSFAV